MEKHVASWWWCLQSQGCDSMWYQVSGIVEQTFYSTMFWRCQQCLGCWQINRSETSPSPKPCVQRWMCKRSKTDTSGSNCLTFFQDHFKSNSLWSMNKAIAIAKLLKKLIGEAKRSTHLIKRLWRLRSLCWSKNILSTPGDTAWLFLCPIFCSYFFLRLVLGSTNGTHDSKHVCRKMQICRKCMNMQC